MLLMRQLFNIITSSNLLLHNFLQFTHRINPSRLRSPRLWTVSLCNASGEGGGDATSAKSNGLALAAAKTTATTPSLSTLLEPPPYTPPPMLSPNRRGSGLFSSIARSRRPPRTATSNLRTVSTATGSVAIAPTSSDLEVAKINRNTSGAACTAVSTRKRAILSGSPKSAPAFVKNSVYFSEVSALAFTKLSKCKSY